MASESAPPVLLVHGFASSFERNWQELGWVDVLADEGRTVVGADLPGHGRAAKPHDPDAYRDLHLAVREMLPSSGRVDAVGFSMGAGLLLAVAATEPERFRKIVVGGVGGGLFRTGDPEPLARAVESGEVSDDAPSALRALARFARAPGNDPLALAACIRRPPTRFDPSDLAGLTTPVLVVLGERDFAGPAEPLVEALPNASLTILPGTDHFGTPKDFRFMSAAVGFLGSA